MPFARAALMHAAPLLMLSAVRPPATATSAPQKYSGCPPGYTFQTSGNNARCYLAGTQAMADIYCGVGYVKATDQTATPIPEPASSRCETRTGITRRSALCRRAHSRRASLSW